MNQNEIAQKLETRVQDLELQMSGIMKIVSALQTENQELRKLIFSCNDSPNKKRPGSNLSSGCMSIKKFKHQLITPLNRPLQESKSLSENNQHSSQRRKVMNGIVKNFHSNILPRYQDHLSNERNSIPALRGNDGRIILTNIRYIR